MVQQATCKVHLMLLFCSLSVVCLHNIIPPRDILLLFYTTVKLKVAVVAEPQLALHIVTSIHSTKAMPCYHVYVIMHVNDPWLSVVRVGHRVPLAGFCRFPYSVHVQNKDVNMMQVKNPATIQ